MGRKGSWFSAVKRIFMPNSKERPVNGSEKRSTKEKKKDQGVLRHGDTKSFIPLFREPSSIEKILGEVDQQKLLISSPTRAEQLQTPPLELPGAASPTVPSPQLTSPKATSPRNTSARAASSIDVHNQKEVRHRPEPTLRYHNLSAIKLQAAYRGYMARKSFRALRGLVRLQGAVRGHNVKQQTVNAMRMMQLLVRVQTQIQSRRIQMLENQRQAYKNDKEMEISLGKWTVSQSDAGLNEEWDDSLLTKEEIEARLHRKAEAIVKRERAMAYAYSHTLWKANPKSAQTSVMDIRPGGFPWWWNWLDRQLPPTNPSQSQSMKSFQPTLPRPSLEPKPSPCPPSSNFKQHNIGFDNLEALTPRSSTKSAVPVLTRPLRTPSNRTQTNRSILKKNFKPKLGSAFDSPNFDVSLKDDDSLMSCPPFSVPNYMTPTVSAKAKVREDSNINLKDGSLGTPCGDSNRRFSFTNIGSFKWKKGSSSTSQRVLEKQQSSQSIGDLSIDSAVSMPAAVGRKPFNRFV